MSYGSTTTESGWPSLTFQTRVWPAALFMMSSRTLLKGSAIARLEPGVVLEEVNDLLYKDNPSLMFVTVLYAIYDPATGQITYANGGHNPPLIVHPDGSSTVLPSTGGIALGVMPGLCLCTEYRDMRAWRHLCLLYGRRYRCGERTRRRVWA